MNLQKRFQQDFSKKGTSNGKWYWEFRNWVSKAYPYLEERPWTPQIINDKLCFSAMSDDNKWIVVWGNNEGRKYDDVFDIQEFDKFPVYVARNQSEWFLVYGNRESQKYPFQITYRIIDKKIQIYRFPYDVELQINQGFDPQWE